MEKHMARIYIVISRANMIFDQHFFIMANRNKQLINICLFGYLVWGKFQSIFTTANEQLMLKLKASVDQQRINLVAISFVDMVIKEKF